MEDHCKKNKISLCSAGGGKTTRLLEQALSFDPLRTLVISFTNSSCKDIELRSDNKIGAQTIHSFCYSFLFGYNLMENPMDLVGVLSQDSSLSDLRILPRLVDAYNVFKNKTQTEKPKPYLSKEDQELNREFLKLMDRVETEKKKQNILFFCDIIEKFQEEIDNFLPSIYESYDHFLLDEAQDLSIVQLKLIEKIILDCFIEPGKSFYVVGDVKQSIYDFQGASPTFYLEFLERIIKNCKERGIPVELERNNRTYRFGGEILNLVNKTFEIHTSDKEQGTVREIGTYDPVETIEALIELHREEDVLVIYRNNDSVVTKVQTTINKGFDLKVWTADNQVVQALKDVAEYIYGSKEQKKWYEVRILQGLFVGLGEPEIMYRTKLNAIGKEFFESILKENERGLRFLLEFLAQSLKGTALDREVFKQIYKTCYQYGSIGELIFRMPEVIRICKEGIRFSTIHGAKGLEAEVVIFLEQKKKLGLSLSLDPFFFSTTTRLDRSVDESLVEENLRYVAMTRAKSCLYVVRPEFEE